LKFRIVNFIKCHIIIKTEKVQHKHKITSNPKEVMYDRKTNCTNKSFMLST